VGRVVVAIFDFNYKSNTCGAIVGLGISYDQISFEYDEKEKLG
jgi:hypothetical protein